jgi:hypothetical protein
MTKTLVRVNNGYINLELVTRFSRGFDNAFFVLHIGSEKIQVDRVKLPDSFAVIEDWLRAHELKPRPRPAPRTVAEGHRPGLLRRSELSNDDRLAEEALHFERVMNEAGRSIVKDPSA